MSKLYVSLCCLLSINTLMAQQQREDSAAAVVLREIVIDENRIKASETGLNETAIDKQLLSLVQGYNMSELLQLSGLGQIRAYGPSGLSSPNFRGTGASRTAVLWNGIPIQSPLSGQQDLSQLPAEAAGSAALQTGGATGLYGNGAIGGSIQLNSQPAFKQGLSLSTTHRYGSFQNHYQNYKVHWSSEAFSTSTQFFSRSLDNDFEYEYHGQTLRRRNSKSDYKGVIHQSAWRMNEKNLLGIRLWYQGNQLQIPNTIYASQNTRQRQNDETLRALIDWHFGSEQIGLTAKQAFIQHQLNYIDPDRNTDSNSSYNSWISRLEMELNLTSSISLLSALMNTYESTRVDNFGSLSPTRNNTALFSSLRTSFKKLKLAFNIRQELIDGELAPFTLSIGVEFKQSPVWLFKSSFSRNYRLPTFNDLYWRGQSSGNPNLAAENSWNAEFSTVLSPQKTHLPTLTLGVYHSTVHNWIDWTPRADDSEKWSPENIKQVLARGVESKLEGAFKLKAFSCRWLITYQFTKTTDIGDSRIEGNQLTYTPLHEGSFSSTLSLNKVSWMVLGNYTGKQYTDESNNELTSLPAYLIWTSIIDKSFQFKSIRGSVQFKINNLANQSYENRRGYPMYGRNYAIGLNINFKTINHG